MTLADVNNEALPALVRDVRRRNEWSVRDVAARAVSAGHHLTRTDVSNYGTVGMPTIVPRKVMALAAGLAIPPYVVWFAVLQDAGVEIPQVVRTPEEAIAQDVTLPAKSRHLLLTLIAEARKDGLGGPDVDGVGGRDESPG